MKYAPGFICHPCSWTLQGAADKERICDPAVIREMGEVPREEIVADELVEFAWDERLRRVSMKVYGAEIVLNRKKSWSE